MRDLLSLTMQITIHLALDKDIDSVITKLENNSCNLFQWLSDNALKANPRKSHLLFKYNIIAASINNNLIYNENNVDLLGITIDNPI